MVRFRPKADWCRQGPGSLVGAKHRTQKPNPARSRKDCAGLLILDEMGETFATSTGTETLARPKRIHRPTALVGFTIRSPRAKRLTTARGSSIPDPTRSMRQMPMHVTAGVPLALMR